MRGGVGGLARSVCPGSGDGLAGESPVSVVAKRRCSWWPVEGETRPSKRHDKVALGGEQATGPQHEANLAASLRSPAWQGKEREPSPDYGGEGHGRCEDLGCAAPMNPPAYGGWNGCTARHRTGEIRLGTGSRVTGVPSRGAPVAAKPISATREVVQRRAEVGGGRSSGDRCGQHNPP
jgi:hypothetical protein